MVHGKVTFANSVNLLGKNLDPGALAWDLELHGICMVFAKVSITLCMSSTLPA